jgi:hypothetical protein
MHAICNIFDFLLLGWGSVRRFVFFCNKKTTKKTKTKKKKVIKLEEIIILYAVYILNIIIIN